LLLRLLLLHLLLLLLLHLLLLLLLRLLLMLLLLLLLQLSSRSPAAHHAIRYPSSVGMTGCVSCCARVCPLLLLLLLTLAVELHLWPVDCVWCHVYAGLSLLGYGQLHIWLPRAYASPNTPRASDGACGDTKALAHSKPCLQDSITSAKPLTAVQAGRE
jgi:hypothetical protein